MVEVLIFSAMICCNLTIELVDDQMVDDLVSMIAEIGLVVRFGMCCFEKTTKWGLVNLTLLLLSCATQMQVVDNFYNLLGPNKSAMFWHKQLSLAKSLREGDKLDI